ncbi:phosphatase PAP2 family protein [Chromobacterium phragmitis]|uniref:phosphatase PAP2 family protein n=1 Tax=Chromobacterium amazonense TaxID=1382803 RepID=UPI0021B75709|nr:phosphatase PAP2 family protein [Chromobacterium amazonense]MBM2884786.1 phosphatase PAP2 family protein [Chromobacterium amazonense]
MSCLKRFWPACVLALLGVGMLIWPQANQQGFLALNGMLNALPAPAWRFLSIFGDWPTALALMLAWSWRDPKRLPALIVAGVVGIALSIGLKAGFNVPRPPLVLPPGTVELLDRLPGNGSFPSGHALASAALAAFVCQGMGRTGRWACYGAAALVALSRIAIGVHWPLDLLAGALLGWGTMRLALARCWPGGWPRDVERTAEMILLVLLSGALAWLLGQRAMYADYWLRVGIAGAVVLLGFIRLARRGH